MSDQPSAEAKRLAEPLTEIALHLTSDNWSYVRDLFAAALDAAGVRSDQEELTTLREQREDVEAWQRGRAAEIRRQRDINETLRQNLTGAEHQLTALREKLAEYEKANCTFKHESRTLRAENERLRVALKEPWCPDCGKVLESPNPGIAEGMEAAASVQPEGYVNEAADDWACGYDKGVEDMRAAIRAKAKEQTDE